jgi:long-chain acyl-CoA synthetase
MSSHKHPVEMLFQWARECPDKPWLHQPTGGSLVSYTWKQAADMIGSMAAAMKAQGWPPGSCIAICGINTAHWFMTDLAAQLAGLVPVGLYPKQATRMTRYILEHCEAKAIFVGPMPDAEEFMLGIPPGIPKIAFPYHGTPACDTDWDRFRAGHAPIREYRRPSPETVMMLVYTSGTTGNPKGVMMTYGNLEFVGAEFLDKVFKAGPDERFFSYLPLAHLLERAGGLGGSLYSCADVFFLEELDRDKVLQVLRSAAPTRFVAIPLIWTRFHSSLAAKIPERWLRRLVRLPLLGAFLRRRLLSLIGLQNVRTAFSGGAPLPRSTYEFFRDVFGIEIFEAYGQTENSAYCSIRLAGEFRPGSVGKPLPNAGFRLSPEGEIQVKHPGVMAGYYKDPEQTRAAFTEDGWLRTGDKGRLDTDGHLYISGRFKEIFKTLKGKYVAPAPIELALARNTDIDQLCLVGAGLTQPVMLLTLSADARRKSREALGVALLAGMTEVNATLEDHERIAKLVVAAEEWTIENGFMTPTMKVKRDVIERHYGGVVEREARNRGKTLVWLEAMPAAATAATVGEPAHVVQA